MIEVKNIIKSFPNTPTPVLKGINLKIEDGDFVSLVGKSGSGKSTLLYIIKNIKKRTFKNDRTRAHCACCMGRGVAARKAAASKGGQGSLNGRRSPPCRNAARGALAQHRR